jgi:hypothetical protein
MDLLNEQQWQESDRAGFLRLGQVLDSAELAAVQQRMDVLGRVRHPGLQ